MTKLEDLKNGQRVFIGGGVFQGSEGTVVGFLSGQVNVNIDGIGDQLLVPRILYITKEPPFNEAWPLGFPSVASWIMAGRQARFHPLFLAVGEL